MIYASKKDTAYFWTPPLSKILMFTNDTNMQYTVPSLSMRMS